MAEKGPHDDHESRHSEVEAPSPGATRVMERYKGIRDSKWRHDGVEGWGCGGR